MKIENLNGFLMSRDIELAKIENGQIAEVLNEKLLPIYIARTQNLEEWLRKRAIDEHRANSRLLKKVLRLTEKDDVSTTLAVNAVTITDTYWIKPQGSELTWEDVRFKENYFSELALRGDLSAFSQHPSRTPELTNIGSFEKCWKLENEKWWLYKRANKFELFSELFVYYLGKELGFSMAHYEVADGDIRSLDFTDGAKVNYEPAYSFIGDDDDYVHNYDVFAELGEDIADRYVEMILLDTYCLNADRHTLNYGVLRNAETGEILSLAPNFDNNIALVYNGYPAKDRQEDLLGRLLWDVENERRALSNYVSRNRLPVVTEELIERCIDAVCSETGIDIDRDVVRRFVMAGYEQTPIPQLAETASK